MKKHLSAIISFWKSIWGKLVAFTICESIVALFIASFCLDKSLTLAVMNEWVSLVVGMVALILGIISLFLSFYNVEQSNEVQRVTIEIMHDVKDDLANQINSVEKKIDSGFAKGKPALTKVDYKVSQEKDSEMKEDSEENV